MKQLNLQKKTSTLSVFLKKESCHNSAVTLVKFKSARGACKYLTFINEYQTF